MSLRRVSAFGALLAIAACGIYGRSEDSPAPVTDAGDPNDGGSSGDAGAAPTAAIHGFSKRARIGDDNADIARPPNTQTGDLLLLFGYGAGAVTIDGFTSVGTRGGCAPQSGLKLFILTRVAADGDPPSFLMKTSVTQTLEAVLVAISGAAAPTPIDDFTSAVAEAGALDIPAVTVQHDRALGAIALVGPTDTTWDSPPPSLIITRTEDVVLFASSLARGRSLVIHTTPTPDGCTVGAAVAVALQ